ncbi:MAG: PQQ-binding-like beta-propeller repeat protein [Phycisphaerae bacterium]|nr:PQQ-binding-like beta-propeller repeat protein [Phycisphaerae bacterium]
MFSKTAALCFIIGLSVSILPSQAATSVKIVSLDAYDVVYDSFSQRIYASVPSAAAAYGNNLAVIDPVSGVIEDSVFVGSDPQKLAVSGDGEYIYIGLNGAGSVSRFHIPSKTVETFSLGTGSDATTYAEDIAVQPGNSKVIAVSRYRKGVSPRNYGVAVYDNGIKRPQQISGANVIEFSDSPGVLYGYNNETTEFAVRTLIVNDYGVSTAAAKSGLISGFGVDMEYADGFLYSTNGGVVNTQLMQLAGQFGVSGKLEPDPMVRRVFFADGATLKAFNTTTFLLEGQETVSGVSGSPRNLIRWGSKGLAFSTSGKQVVIVETDLVPLPPAVIRLTIDGPDYLTSYKGQYKLIAEFDDGTVADVTRKSRWTTVPDTYTHIDNTGRLYVLGTDQAGTANISAEYVFAGTQYTAVKTISYEGIIPAAGNLVRLQIDGPSQVLQQSTVQMTGTAFFDDGASYDVTGKAVWSLGSTDFARIDQTGLLTLGAISRPRDLIIYASFGYKDAEAQAAKTVIVLEDASQVSSCDWPTYQGDQQHTGFAAVSLNPQDFSLRWAKTISAGSAMKPVSAAGGRVFIAVNSALLCLDARDGEILWSQSLNSPHHQPTYAYGYVYVQTDQHSPGYIRAFEADTGAQIFASTFSQQWDTWWAPVVYDGEIYIAGGYYGGAGAYNAFTGEKKWNVSLPQYDAWTPAVKGKLMFAYVGGTLYALERKYGTTSYTINDPSFSWQGWSMNLAPVLSDTENVLVIYNGRLKCFDLNAKNIRWEIAGGFSGQPSVAEGMVYAVNSGMLEARDEMDGSLIWSWSAPEGSLKSPLIATRTHVIACTNANTYAVELLGRQSEWSYPASGYLALGNDTLYIAGSNGVLTAIAVPEYIPAEPIKLEIEGPIDIFESSANAYQAIVTYSDGRVRDRTALCSWSVTEKPWCSLDQGLLHVGELLYPQETVALSAVYRQDNGSVADTRLITIHANAAEEGIIARNLEKAMQSKQKILYELQQAMMYEAASGSIAEDLKQKSSKSNSGISRPLLNKAVNQIEHALNFETVSRKHLEASIVNLAAALEIFASDSPSLGIASGMVVPQMSAAAEAVGCPYALTGDLDSNCSVNMTDLMILAENWLVDCSLQPANPACQQK